MPIITWFNGRAQGFFLAAFSWGQNCVYSLRPVKLGFLGFECHSENHWIFLFQGVFPLQRTWPRRG